MVFQNSNSTKGGTTVDSEHSGGVDYQDQNNKKEFRLIKIDKYLQNNQQSFN